MEKGRYSVVFLGPDEERIKKLQRVLEDYEIEAAFVSENDPILTGKIQITEGSLQTGFELPSQKLAVITEEELFNKRTKRKPAGKSFRMQKELKAIPN